MESFIRDIWGQWRKATNAMVMTAAHGSEDLSMQMRSANWCTCLASYFTQMRPCTQLLFLPKFVCVLIQTNVQTQLCTCWVQFDFFFFIKLGSVYSGRYFTTGIMVFNSVGFVAFSTGTFLCEIFSVREIHAVYIEYIGLLLSPRHLSNFYFALIFFTITFNPL